MKKQLLYLLVIGILVVLMGCNKDQNSDAKKSTTQASSSSNLRSSLPNSVLDIGDEKLTVRPIANPLRNAYFGDLHVHTAYYFDAFVFGTLTP